MERSLERLKDSKRPVEGGLYKDLGTKMRQFDSVWKGVTTGLITSSGQELYGADPNGINITINSILNGKMEEMPPALQSHVNELSPEMQRIFWDATRGWYDTATGMGAATGALIGPRIPVTPQPTNIAGE
jgi:hypothetical protein